MLLLPWVRRLDGVLGAAGRGNAAAAGEPDGYDGVDSRGPYHRLVSSQWLLADLYPDEFLRRAVTGEHVFFRLAYQSPEVDHAVVALLDMGPDQLGAPRLAQLAALVVLLQRAGSRGARLYWGSLQASRPTLFEGLGRPQIEGLFGGRSPRRATFEDGERWHAWLTDHHVGADCWLLGAPRLVRFPATRSLPQLAFDVPMFAETGHVEVTSRAAGSTVWQRGTHLPLPEQALAVRLLRDPFGEARSTPRSAPALNARGGLHLSSDGRSVTMRIAAGGVVSHPIPNSPNATPGRPRYFQTSPRQRILAATRVGKRMHAVTLNGCELLFVGLGTERADTGHACVRRTVQSQVIESLALGTDLDEDPLGELEVFRNENGVGMIMRPPSGVILTLMPKKGGDYRIRTGPVTLAIASAGRGKGCLFARRTDGAVTVREQPGGVLARIPVPADRVARTFLGHGSFAVQQGDRDYRVRRWDGTEQVLSVPSGCTMVGTLGGGLVVLEPDERYLLLLTRGVCKTLLRPPTRLVQVRVAVGAPILACLDERGEVTVVSTAHSAPLLNIVPQSDRALA